MDMQTTGYQQDDYQHGGAKCPTVLIVILLCIKWLRDHKRSFAALRMTEGAQDDMGRRRSNDRVGCGMTKSAE